MKSKSAERMLKTLYPSMIKMNEKQERRTHAKKTLSKHNKSGLKARAQNSC